MSLNLKTEIKTSLRETTMSQCKTVCRIANSTLRRKYRIWAGIRNAIDITLLDVPTVFPWYRWVFEFKRLENGFTRGIVQKWFFLTRGTFVQAMSPASWERNGFKGYDDYYAKETIHWNLSLLTACRYSCLWYKSPV